MFDKLRLAIAAYRVYRDPNRLEDILEAGTRLVSSRTKETEALVLRLAETSEAAARSFEDRHIIRYDLEELAACPNGSLGRALHDHCRTYGINPSTFPTRPTETRAQYVLAHIENTHDVWHPVAGFGSDRSGEIGLQAFYMAQFPNMLGLLLLAIAPLHILDHDPSQYPRYLEEITRGWLLGKRAKLLFGVRWDTMWNRPLADVRRELGIDLDAIAKVMEPGTNETVRRLGFPDHRVVANAACLV